MEKMLEKVTRHLVPLTRYSVARAVGIQSLRFPAQALTGTPAGALAATNEDKENQHWGFESIEQENTHPRQGDYVPSY